MHEIIVDPVQQCRSDSAARNTTLFQQRTKKGLEKKKDFDSNHSHDHTQAAWNLLA
jgi:hypothetical protein